MRPVSCSPWIPFAVALSAVVLAYAPVLAGMAVEWSTFPSLSHGFAVPLISAYLLWRRREVIRAEPLAGANVGLLVFAAALAVLLVGSLSGETWLARVSFPLALLGLTLFLAGGAVARHAWTAIAYLLFMIPLPYLALKAATYESRIFEAGATAAALRWLGVPIQQEGVMLYLPSVTLEVADSCSGVHAVAAFVALGAAYALIQPGPRWMRVTLALAAAPLGLISNVLRLALTAVGAHYLGPITLTGVFHRFGGTVVFISTVVLLVGLDRLLLRRPRAVSP
jgi:exosortase